MLEKAQVKKMLMDARIANMQVMKVCLKWYKDTGNEEMFEWAKKFGEWSSSFKKQIDKL